MHCIEIIEFRREEPEESRDELMKLSAWTAASFFEQIQLLYAFIAQKSTNLCSFCVHI